MNYLQILELATTELIKLKKHKLDILTISRPEDLATAIELSKILSKLSPLIGNLIEYAIVKHLNQAKIWPDNCQWIRQDPGFPDTILQGFPNIEPGIEVKTWFPLSTEITARFRDSQAHLSTNYIKVVMVAWMLENILSGQPQILDIWIGDALEIAQRRDEHYHNPPHYIVVEPEDTTQRTRNLQQTNCNGLKFQGTPKQLETAIKLVESWGSSNRIYSYQSEYQILLRELTSRFPYRLDTNFAKMDRIILPSLEKFKADILASTYLGRSLSLWTKAISSLDESVLLPLI